MLTSHAERGRRVARTLYDAFHGLGILGHVDDMPEIRVWRDRDRQSLEHMLFLTFTMAIHRMRDAHALWHSAIATLDDPRTGWLYNPGEVARATESQILATMRKHGLTGRYPPQEARAWRTIGVTLHIKYQGDPRCFMQDCRWDAPTILRRLKRDGHEQHGSPVKDFPLLRGDATGPFWLRVMRDNGQVSQLDNLHRVPIPVNRHIVRGTFAIGVMRGSYAGGVSSGLRRQIQSAWFDAVRSLHVGSRPMIALDVDPPLWTLARYGCKEHRDAESGHCTVRSSCPVGSSCTLGKISIKDRHLQIRT